MLGIWCLSSENNMGIWQAFIGMSLGHSQAREPTNPRQDTSSEKQHETTVGIYTKHHEKYALGQGL